MISYLCLFSNCKQQNACKPSQVTGTFLNLTLNVEHKQRNCEIKSITVVTNKYNTCS